ncbi:MAG: hypothetical protein AAGB31_11905, partial [Bdellovibrio sp.]
MKSLIFIFTFLALGAQAAGPSLTYHGRLLDSSDQPVSGSVSFRIQIRSPGTENCLLWEETQSQTLNEGVFVIAINGATSSRSDGGSHSFAEVFSNRKSFSFAAGKCDSGTTYVPSSTDARLLRVSF